MKAVVPGSSSLLEDLERLVPGASRRTLRQMLAQGRVSVNGEIRRLAAHPLSPGDTIEIGGRTAPSPLPRGLEVLHEDDALLVIRKPTGLLTVATLHEKERTAYAYLRAYVKAREPRRRLYIVHRLDKFASGILVFAKSEPVQSALQEIFSRHDIERKYWAIVEGGVKQNQGTIRSRLAQDRSLRMHSTEDETRGKEAITHYRVLRRTADLSVLEVTLETGRKNQIRAHLSEMGHPIVGDRAYGCTRDPLKRMGLHAFRLGFRHPVTGEPVRFETGPPPEFVRYLPAGDS
jgi:23S rRNA pseudouridine1911/1915/1917 synthase